ncbi:hypothetical protein V7087_18490 [Neobacillus niacini]|uniref:hypothetical protein n=1 Tax=Neobacillus niacini TaxID=86668 RepID=UPI003000C07F
MIIVLVKINVILVVFRINLKLTINNFLTLLGDTAGSSLYWAEYIIEPEVTVENATIAVPSSPGFGYTINLERLNKFTVSSKLNS